MHINFFLLMRTTNRRTFHFLFQLKIERRRALFDFCLFSNATIVLLWDNWLEYDDAKTKRQIHAFSRMFPWVFMKRSTLKGDHSKKKVEFRRARKKTTFRTMNSVVSLVSTRRRRKKDENLFRANDGRWNSCECRRYRRSRSNECFSCACFCSLEDETNRKRSNEHRSQTEFRQRKTFDERRFSSKRSNLVSKVQNDFMDDRWLNFSIRRKFSYQEKSTFFFCD